MTHRQARTPAFRPRHLTQAVRLTLALGAASALLAPPAQGVDIVPIENLQTGSGDNPWFERIPRALLQPPLQPKPRTRTLAPLVQPLCPVGGPATLSGVYNNAGTCRIYTTGTLAIDNSGAFINDNQLVNEGTLNTQSGGLLVNNFLLYNLAGATLSSQPGGNLNNNRFLINYAALHTGGSLGNSYRLYNYATLTNQTGGTLTSSNTLINYGSLSNASGASLGSSDRLINYGNLTNAGSLTNSYVLYSSGSLSNQSGASLSNSSYLINTGALNNNAGASLSNTYRLINQSGGTLSNAGSLSSSFLLYNASSLTNASGGSLTNSGYLINAGTLTNQSGATLSNSTGATLENHSSGTLSNRGVLHNNGSLTNAGQFQLAGTGQVDGPGTFLQTGGSTRVDDDGLLEAALIQFYGGALSGAGTLASSSPISIGATARVDPGNATGILSTGTLSLAGDFTLDGALNIELAWQDDFDVLDVGGTALFGPGSEINFILLNSFLPLNEDSFEFLLATGLLGLDDVSYSISQLPAGWNFEVLATATDDLQIRFSVVVPLPPALPLFGSALVGLALLAKRRRQTGRVPPSG